MRAAMATAAKTIQSPGPDLLFVARFSFCFDRGVAYSNVFGDPITEICRRNGVAMIGDAIGAAYCAARSRTPHRGQNAACGNTCFRHRGHGV